MPPALRRLQSGKKGSIEPVQALSGREEGEWFGNRDFRFGPFTFNFSSLLEW